MTKKKCFIAAAVLLAAVLTGILAKKPIYNLYRDIAFYFGERSQAEQTVHAYARQQRISYGEYPYDIIDLLETNPETAEFVLNYPFRKNRPIDLGGYDRSTVPLFLQWDPQWGYEIYGSSYLAVTGCGPTCLAMAGYYLTGDPAMNPLELSRFAETEGYYIPGVGSSWTLFSEGGEKLELDVRELPLMKSKIVDTLDAGNPVVLALGKGDFTSAGHYVVLSASEEGGFRVNDPNSPIRSAKLWTYEELEPQIKNIWSISRADR